MAPQPYSPFANVWVYFFVAVVVAAWIWRWLAAKKRRAEISSIATGLGLISWPDGNPPLDISLYGTPFEKWTSLSNIYAGDLNNRQVAIMDFRKRVGRSVWSRTIIAVKTVDDVFSSNRFNFEHQWVHGWQLAYYHVGFFRATNLMDVNAIKGMLENLRRA